MSEAREPEEIARACARQVRGCATDEQYKAVFAAIAAAIAAERTAREAAEQAEQRQIQYVLDERTAREKAEANINAAIIYCEGVKEDFPDTTVWMDNVIELLKGKNK